MTSATLPPIDLPQSTDRVERRRVQRQRMLQLTAMSYAVDAAMMALLAWLGTLDAIVPLAYAACAAVALFGFHLLLDSPVADQAADHYLTLPQMATAIALHTAFVLWVPQIGVLLMMVLFIVFSFGALRMSPRLALGTIAFTALPICLVTLLVGEQLDLPKASPGERAVSGLWMAAILARSVVLGFFGSRLRETLVQRNHQLAATFDRLDHLASRDELTGALNRRRILQLLDAERERLQRHGQRFAVVLFDLDHFKTINDRFGHPAGDEVLRRFIRLVLQSARGPDCVARIGGEEFLLMLPAIDQTTSACAVAERVRAATATAGWGDLTPGVAITVSAGAAVARPGEDVSQLLSRADQALYRAKHDGRDCVRA